MNFKTLFETWSSVSSYNVLWTLLQPFVIGLFDQYVSARILDRYPALYRLGQKSVFYNHGVFWAWIATSFIQSAIIFFCWTGIVGDSTVLIDGRTIDNWVFGCMVYASDLLAVMLKACLVVDTWVLLTFIAIFGSFIAYFALFVPVSLCIILGIK
jgi:phospholipid-transporting ATPase